MHTDAAVHTHSKSDMRITFSGEVEFVWALENVSVPVRAGEVHQYPITRVQLGAIEVHVASHNAPHRTHR